MAQPLFDISNCHAKASGTPPAVDWDKVRFSSYFRNERGDQCLCWLDDRGVHLASGFIGWETIVTIRVAELRYDEVRVPLVLTASERLWISACFSAIRGGGIMVAAVGVKG